MGSQVPDDLLSVEAIPQMILPVDSKYHFSRPPFHMVWTSQFAANVSSEKKQVFNLAIGLISGVIQWLYDRPCLHLRDKSCNSTQSNPKQIQKMAMACSGLQKIH